MQDEYFGLEVVNTCRRRLCFAMHQDHTFTKIFDCHISFNALDLEAGSLTWIDLLNFKPLVVDPQYLDQIKFALLIRTEQQLVA